jgi:hypothetical protein
MRRPVLERITESPCRRCEDRLAECGKLCGILAAWQRCDLRNPPPRCAVDTEGGSYSLVPI